MRGGRRLCQNCGYFEGVNKAGGRFLTVVVVSLGEKYCFLILPALVMEFSLSGATLFRKLVNLYLDKLFYSLWEIKFYLGFLFPFLISTFISLINWLKGRK